MILEIIGHDFEYEVENIVRLFYFGSKILKVKEPFEGVDNFVVTTRFSPCEKGFELYTRIKTEKFDNCKMKVFSSELSSNNTEIALCTMIFDLFVEMTGKKPPWGIITGVRPVRIVNNLKREGKTDEEIEKEFESRFLADEDKTKLAIDTAHAQEKILKRLTQDQCSLYVSIPFCPTRCLYCSFVSHSIESTVKLIPEYLDNLCEEITYTAKLASNMGLRFQTVYIGGGTPTSIDEAQLEQVMRAVGDNIDVALLDEYTVEAGRPDTFTEQKMEIIKRYGAKRISINPQTLNDEVLKTIGRAHTAEEFFRAFEMARNAGINEINTDLIIGLPNESCESFLDGVERIIGLNPENITVHALTNKRSSTLRKEDYEIKGGLAIALVQAQKMLKTAGYKPYYLYRQKGTVDNLENTGYSLEGKYGIYNINIMEEVQTIFGVGAGATTKLVLPGKKIDRIYNYKYPYEYNSGLKEMLKRKEAVKKYYERD